jgi:phage host-nuclease inhibitor protein Gam
MSNRAIKRTTLGVPQSMDEADALLAELGRLERERRLIQAALDEKVAAAKKDAEDQALLLGPQMQALTARLQAWAEANRQTLTKGGKTKTVKLPAGTIAWKLGRPSLTVADEAAAIAKLRALGRPELLRVVAALDKAALLERPMVVAQLPGVAIVTPGEEFKAKPLKLPLAEVAHG